MRYETVDSFVLPGTQCSLEIGHVEAEMSGEIKDGTLVAPSDNKSISVRNFIARFRGDNSYVTNFGLQWNRHRRTQIDRFNGTRISMERFYSGTGWSSDELRGERILEVGCGAGRFTQIMLDAGAEVWSLDYSSAVDACWINNGPHPRLSVVQGDLYAMPFRKGYFDKVFCYGVLQHTPDVKGAFMNLPQYLKPGGKLAVDVYLKSRWPSRWTSKYLWRPITKRTPHELLFRIVEWYVPRWLPIDNRLQRIPALGQCVAGMIPCWNYTGMLPLTQEQVREWAILDTFDALSPTYDFPQTISEVRSWFEKAELSDIDVRQGGIGILGRARKALPL
jgi:SAM-dependent methyltransferase